MSTTRPSTAIVRKGPLKGQRVEVAPRAGIAALDAIAASFMLAVFGFEHGEYLITDLSSAYDFVGVRDMTVGDIHARVQEVYGLDLADVRGWNLLAIFNQLRRRPARCPRTQRLAARLLSFARPTDLSVARRIAAAGHLRF